MQVHWSDNFSIVSYKVRNAKVTFAEKPQIRINSLKKQEHGYQIHTWSDKAFKGTVVNRVLPSLLGESLEIMRTVPLTRYTIQKLPTLAICTKVKIILDILNDFVRCVESFKNIKVGKLSSVLSDFVSDHQLNFIHG